MYKNLRIIFCVLAVLFAAACIFIFVYFSYWGFICVALAAVCGFLMVYCKRKQEKEEGGLNPSAPEGDFITGRVTAVNVKDRLAAYNSAVTVEDGDGNARTFIIVNGEEESFDKVGIKSPLGKAVWHKKAGDEITYTDGELKERTITIINIE